MRLSITQVSKTFDGVVALKDVTVEFLPGTITTIVGPNGAGKTTLFNVISGYVKPERGAVFLEGKNIVGQRPHAIAAAGVGRLFQDPRIFKSLSVLDNLLVAAKELLGENPFSAMFQIRKIKLQQKDNLEEARRIADFLGIVHLTEQSSSILSHGQKKLLAIGQLLMRRSGVLLLDEATAGLDKNAIDHLLGLLRELADQGRTIVLIEHRWELTKHISDVMSLLNAGNLIAAGNPSEVIKSCGNLEALW